MTAEINKIYWITHPAFSVKVADKQHRLTARQAGNFIRQIIVPIIKTAQHDPNAIVVLVKTKVSGLPPSLLMQHEDPGASSSRERKTVSIENELERLALRLLKKRAIVVTAKPEEKAAFAVAEKIRENGLFLSINPSIEGFGSYWKKCSRSYPNEFKKIACSMARVRTPETGSIKLRSRRFRK